MYSVVLKVIKKKHFIIITLYSTLHDLTSGVSPNTNFLTVRPGV